VNLSRHRFIREQTEIATPPLLPEIQLYLASEITAIWQATETSLEQKGLAPPFWAFCWAGGQALAHYVLDTPEIVAGQRVLDFAAGCGVAAIAAARAGALRVTACDIDPTASAACQINAALNGVEIEVIHGDLLAAERDWDVILAGDVCYERAMAADIVRALRGHVRRGAMVLIGDPGRTYMPEIGFEQVASYDVPTSPEIEDRDMRSTAILRLQG